MWENSTIIVEEEESYKRLDKLLSDRFEKYSRTYFQNLISSHLVLVNGEIVKKRQKPSRGDEIEIQFALTDEISLEPENISLDIIYEDDDLLIINKPKGMVVHPGAGHFQSTFVNALLYHCKNLPVNNLRPGIVHRLDKETTGLLMAAKTQRSHEKLVLLFSTRQIKKEYLAICLGNPGIRHIAKSIGRHPTKRKQMSVVEEGGKEAVTKIRTLSHNEMYSLVRLFPETGRTHQLRVHLQYLKTPILGDDVYGNRHLNKKLQIERPLLHARRLEFIHPFSQEKLLIEAPIPHDFLPFLSQLSCPQSELN